MQENSVFVILKIYTDNLYITLDFVRVFLGASHPKKSLKKRLKESFN
jgi:hypothetical protein